MAQPSMMNMFSTHQLINHFNNKIRSDSSSFKLTENEFINETIQIVFQVIMIGVFTGLISYLSGSFDRIIRVIWNTIIHGSSNVINHIYKLFKREKRQFKIVKNVPLITSSLLKNSDLHTKLMWFFSSEFCVKISNDNLLNINNVKEIYYIPMGADINTTDKDVKLNESPIVGTDMMILFEGYHIRVKLINELIEVHGDLDTTKRDNMIYQLETYSDDEDSDIIQRLCNYAIIKHNTTKQKWEQKIFNHTGGQWDNGVKCYSPDIKSIVLRDNMMTDILGIMDFFHNNETYYINNGMRYKNILLYLGYPGTGKTTFSCAMANRYRRNIYNININKITKQEDLKQLMDSFSSKVTSGIIMIDDIDHMDAYNDKEIVMVDKNMDEKQQIVAQKYKVSVHDLLSFFDGLNTIHGLIVIICANDPLKFFKQDEHGFSAICRDQRINHIFEFNTCNKKMIKTIYNNIFGKEPNEILINKIEDDYYAPCTIAKVFSSFYEKNGGNITNKELEIDQILIDLANKNIKTNDEIIIEYSKKYQRDHMK